MKVNRMRSLSLELPNSSCSVYVNLLWGESHFEFRTPPLLPRDSDQVSGFWICILNEPLGGGEQSGNTALGNPYAVGDTHTHTTKSGWENQKMFLRGGSQLFRKNTLPGSTWLPGPRPHSIKIFLSLAVKPI